MVTADSWGTFVPCWKITLLPVAPNFKPAKEVQTDLNILRAATQRETKKTSTDLVPTLLSKEMLCSLFAFLVYLHVSDHQYATF